MKNIEKIHELLEDIHHSLVNGNRKQMVEQIDKYGLYDFWSDYQYYLDTLYGQIASRYHYYCDAVTSYHRITNR